jgi:hypothetical protein
MAEDHTLAVVGIVALVGFLGLLAVLLLRPAFPAGGVVIVEPTPSGGWAIIERPSASAVLWAPVQGGVTPVYAQGVTK